MQRTRTAISGILGSLGIALLVVGLALAMENTAAAKDEDGNIAPCSFCSDTCDEVPDDEGGGCSGFCEGWLCGATCACRRDRTNTVCLCKPSIFDPAP